MTVKDVLRLLAERWLVSALGLVLTVAGVVWAGVPRTVYWASTTVALLPTRQGAGLVPLGQDAIPLAGAVVARLTSGAQGPGAVSPDVSIVDRGIYDGWIAFVPDFGGQWAHNFTNPVIVVQASGASDEIVLTRMHSLEDQIQTILAELQSEFEVRSSVRVKALSLPVETSVTIASGITRRAQLAALALGLLLTVMTAFACRCFAPGSRPRG